LLHSGYNAGLCADVSMSSYLEAIHEALSGWLSKSNGWLAGEIWL